MIKQNNFSRKKYLDYFHKNRKKIQETLNGSIAIFAGNKYMQSRADMTHAFVQDASFWWLCGIEEPGCILVLLPEKSVLFFPEISEAERVFNGEKNEHEIREISGVDEVFSMALFEDFLEKKSLIFSTCFTIFPSNKYYLEQGVIQNPAAKNLQKLLQQKFQSVESIESKIHTIRAIKNDFEIAGMRRAISQTIDGFECIKKDIDSYNFEYEIEADFSHFFRTKNNAKHAYQPIVASGKNACTLHYIENNSPLANSQFCLIDIGAEVGGFCGDITRTYAKGEATQRQLEIHQAVQKAQSEIISLIRPNLLIDQYVEESNSIMKRHLVSLGLMKDDRDIANFYRYMPHAVSHGLGIDVHESFGEYDAFREGMILTVEPGIYIPNEEIGVRIEDNILVTREGNENLSAMLSTDFS